MKTHQEIEQRLQEVEQESASHLDWLNKARERYYKDRNSWGSDVDDGEVRIATEAYRESIVEILALQWVLNIEEKTKQQ